MQMRGKEDGMNTKAYRLTDRNREKAVPSYARWTNLAECYLTNCMNFGVRPI